MSDVVTALEEWLEGDEGVAKFGLKLNQEWVDVASLGFIAGYEAALKHEWVGLTDQDVDAWNIFGDDKIPRLVRAVEAKLKEKNT